MDDKRYDEYLDEEYQKYLKRGDDDAPSLTDEECEKLIEINDLEDYYEKQLGDLPTSSQDWDDFTGFEPGDDCMNYKEIGYIVGTVFSIEKM